MIGLSNRQVLDVSQPTRGSCRGHARLPQPAGKSGWAGHTAWLLRRAGDIPRSGGWCLDRVSVNGGLMGARQDRTIPEWRPSAGGFAMFRVLLPSLVALSLTGCGMVGYS